MPRPISCSLDVAADVDTAYRALTSPDWAAALEEHLHDGSTLVRRDETAEGGAVLVISRRLPEGGPAAMRQLGPADGLITQTDTWGPVVDGERRGTFSATYPGSPGTISGTQVVEPTATGSRWVVTGQVHIRVPLLGGKIEGFLAPLVERLIERQGEVLHEQLG